MVWNSHLCPTFFIGQIVPKIVSNQMSLEPQTNENTCLVDKDWADDDTLEEIVKYEYEKTNKSKYIQSALQIRKQSIGEFRRLVGIMYSL
jgi:hypothetical protein